MEQIRTLIALATTLTLTIAGAVLLAFGVELNEDAANTIALTGPQLASTIVLIVFLVRDRKSKSKGSTLATAAIGREDLA